MAPTLENYPPAGFMRPASAYPPPPPPATYAPPPSTYSAPPPSAYAMPPLPTHYPPPPPPPIPASYAPPPRPTSAYIPPQSHLDALSFSSPPRTPRPPTPPSQPAATTAPLPTIESLASINPTSPSSQIAWIKDVLLLVNRNHPIPADQQQQQHSPDATARISDPQLLRLAQSAAQRLIALTSPPPPVLGAPPPPPPPAEAYYIRGTLAANGLFPNLIAPSPRDAFRDYDLAARNGYAPAWFNLGREYETVGDPARARDVFERGIRAGVGSCFYRMGMAHLLGQLGLQASLDTALPLLSRASQLATLEHPQAAYTFALLLLGEFPPLPPLPPHLLTALLAPGQSPLALARSLLERAAYLHFPAAQYKIGHAYEYAAPPFPPDPLLSVQYYALASAGGSPDADLALSKWFLCGAEGAFQADETLAWTFADKAARATANGGLPGAWFAMGYYAEVGIGGNRDLGAAKKWYARAAARGNDDARARLAALSAEGAQGLSRAEHEVLADDQLVRKRTQAWGGRKPQGKPHGAAGLAPPVPAAAAAAPSSTTPAPAPSGSSSGGGGEVMDLVRKSSRLRPPVPAVAQHDFAQPYHHSQQQPPQPSGSSQPPQAQVGPGRKSPRASPPGPRPISMAPPSQVVGGHAKRYSLVDGGAVRPSGAGGPFSSSPPSSSALPGRKPSPGRISPGKHAHSQSQPQAGPSSSRPPPQQQQQQQGSLPPQHQGSLPPLQPPQQPHAQQQQQAQAGGVPAVHVQAASPHVTSPPPPSQHHAGVGAGKPQTFAEMGYHSQKLENKDCIVM